MFVLKPDLKKWELIEKRISNPEGDVTIGLVGKYNTLEDSYKSLIEALIHGSLSNNVKLNIEWVDSEIGVSYPEGIEYVFNDFQKVHICSIYVTLLTQ